MPHTQRGGETERKIFCPTIHSVLAARDRAELIQSEEPGASSGSPTWMQDPMVLGHPQLLSQAISRELEGKWNSRNTNWCPYGMPCLEVEP